MWDERGTEYIDAKGGLWYCAVGHGRAEIADAAREQMVTLAAYDTFGGTANRPALELAERVSAIAPMPNGAVFFGSGGSTRSTPRASWRAATGTRSAGPARRSSSTATAPTTA